MAKGLKWLTGIRLRVLGVLAVPLAALIGVQAVGITSLASVRGELDGLVSTNIPGVVQSYEIELASREMLVETQRALLDSDPDSRNMRIAQARAAAEAFSASVASLSKLDLGEDAGALLPRIKSGGEELIGVLGPVWDYLAKNTMLANEEAQAALETEVPPKVQVMDAVFAEFAGVRDAEINRAAAEASGSLSTFAGVSRVATLD